MKFNRGIKYFQLVAVISLIVFQAGPALSDEAKTVQPKQESATKTTETAKPAATAKTSPSDSVARVNGKLITRGELERATKALAAQNQMGNQAAAPTKQAEDAALDQLISTELLYQEGSKMAMPDLDKKVADNTAQIKAKFPNEAAYENALKSENLTQKELQEEVRKQVVINNLLDKEIISKTTVSDADAKKFYDENIDKFKRGEQIKASHILCKVDPQAKADEKKKAKEKAEGLLKQIKAGKDFAELAKTNSDCPSKAQGGDLGFFGKGQMVPSFETAAFGLKTGEVSDVVETQFGYHLIKVTDKKEAGVSKFDEVKPKIQEYLKNMKIQKGVMAYVAQLKDKAKIEKLTN